MSHQPLLTFDFSETGESVNINCVCSDCAQRNTVPVVTPTAHLPALAIALLAACATLGLDVQHIQADAVVLESPAERKRIEARYQKGLHDFIDREALTRVETRLTMRDLSAYIDRRVIDPVQQVIVCGKKPKQPNEDAA